MFINFNLLKNASSDYEFHKIILDEVGKLVDYEFLEVNNGFEKLTELIKKNQIETKKFNLNHFTFQKQRDTINNILPKKQRVDCI